MSRPTHVLVLDGPLPEPFHTTAPTAEGFRDHALSTDCPVCRAYGPPATKTYVPFHSPCLPDPAAPAGPKPSRRTSPPISLALPPLAVQFP